MVEPVAGVVRQVLHQVLRSSLPCGAVLLSLLLQPGVHAAGLDDRPALEQFVASGQITNRRLKLDLARSSWTIQELRAAVTRAYGLKTGAMARFLATPQGHALVERQMGWWSADLSEPVKAAALRAAIVADSSDGAISLLGVLQRLPVRFELATGAGVSSVPAGSCGCPPGCEGSALAHLSFLIACLQAGATGR